MMKQEFEPTRMREPDDCTNMPACGHWIWNHGWPRCDTCPHRPFADDVSIQYDCDDRGEAIQVPGEGILLDRLVALRTALAFRSLYPCIAASSIGDVIAATFQWSDAHVIDSDDVAFDLRRIEAGAIFQRALSDGWIESFLEGRMPSFGPIEQTRIKLIWIAIALKDRQRAFDLIH